MLQYGKEAPRRDIRMAVAIYTHATDSMQEAATDALEEAFT